MYFSSFSCVLRVLRRGFQRGPGAFRQFEFNSKLCIKQRLNAFAMILNDAFVMHTSLCTVTC